MKETELYTEPDTCAKAAAYLERVPLFTEKNLPGNTRRLLELLGDPQKNFRVIHVAGTNGKGSTCAFLESVFRGMGWKTGLFTSPHLVRMNERIRVMGRDIPDDGFLEAFRAVRKAVRRLEAEGGREPTYFEYLFAMGLWWFDRCRIDLLVCETGLGGRLDATNTIQSVDCVVITSVSLDHMEYLGDTVEKIAAEKAGIIRKDTPVVYCAEDPRCAGVILARAQERNAEQIPLRKSAFSVTEREPGSIGVRLTLPGGEEIALTVPSGALYQAENACLAALCALRLGAGKEAVRAGIENTRWPGRMDEIRRDVFLDGAHNPDGIRCLAAEIRRTALTRTVSLLVAVVSDKNHRDMVRELCRGVKYEGVIVTSAGGGRRLDVRVLAQEFSQAGAQNVKTADDAKEAYRMALREKGDSVLFCTGSLYLIGDILAMENG